MIPDTELDDFVLRGVYCSQVDFLHVPFRIEILGRDGRNEAPVLVFDFNERVRRPPKPEERLVRRREVLSIDCPDEHPESPCLCP